jgi:hypothetical protein
MVTAQSECQGKISEGKLPDKIKSRQTSVKCIVPYRTEYNECLEKAKLLDFAKLFNEPALCYLHYAP